MKTTVILKMLMIATMMWLHGMATNAAPTCRVTRYDENNGLSQWRVTQMLQDYNGVIWMATWNGLNRFDGYEFKCFKIGPKDECTKTDDRIRNIWLSEEGNIYCKCDQGYYYFDTKTYTFHDITDEDDETLYQKLLTKYKGFWLDNLANGDLHHRDANGYTWTVTHDGKMFYTDNTTGETIPYPLEVPMKDLRFGFSDKQGNLWIIFTGGVYKFTFTDNSITHLPDEEGTHVRCTFTDNQRRYWVTGRDKATIRIYHATGDLLGYLGTDGKLHKEYTLFHAPIYCITQSTKGTIWMGSKPGGLFRLEEQKDGAFRISHYVHDPQDNHSLSHNDVYDIKEDSWSRLWIATLGGGINCIPDPESENPQFVHNRNLLNGYPAELCKKVRHLHITNESIMLAATTEGLLVTELKGGKDFQKMTFRHHVKQARQAGSISCSATMDILQDSYGHIFISTESGGVNQIITENLLADSLKFKHFDSKNGLGSDVVLAMTEHEGSLWVVCVNQICILNPYEEINHSFDANFFQRTYRFSEARPLRLPDGRWLFGLHDGAFTMEPGKMRKSDYVPPVIITAISVQNKELEMKACNADTLILQPHERNLTVHFAAIDYTNAERINYSFRLSKGEKAPWTNIGKSRSATFLDIKPGNYTLDICSTNADAIWVENNRTITLIVVPTFWETGWAILLYILIGMTIIGIVLYTYIYIKRINRQKRETLEAYLALLNKPDEKVAPINELHKTEKKQEMNKEDELFMHRIMTFIEEHLADADINIGDMADAVHTSRSGLNRKLKSTLGVTPLDLLREARIKRACQLLEGGELNVSEVAYRCGFADPKYFSRCFKQTMGVSPTEYKETHPYPSLHGGENL